MKFTLIALALCFSLSVQAASTCAQFLEKVSEVRLLPPLSELASSQESLKAIRLEIENRRRGEIPEVSLYNGPAASRWRRWLWLENRWVISRLRAQETDLVQRIEVLKRNVARANDLAQLHALMPEFLESELPGFSLTQSVLLQMLSENRSWSKALALCREFIGFYRESSPASGARFANELKTVFQSYFRRDTATRTYFNRIVDEEIKPRIAAWTAEKKRTALEKLPVPIQRYLESDRREVPPARAYEQGVSNSDLLLSPGFWWFPANVYHPLFKPAQVESEPAKQTLPKDFEFSEAPAEDLGASVRDALELFSPAAESGQGSGDAEPSYGTGSEDPGPATWEADHTSSGGGSSDGGYSDGGYSGGGDGGGGGGDGGGGSSD